MRPTWRKNYLRYRSFFLNVLEHYKARRDLKAYLEILLTLATISVFAIFALRPTLLTIAELIGEIETKRETVATMDEKIKNLTQAQTLYDVERQRIQLLETAMPRNPTPQTLIRQIEATSAKHGATTLSLSIGETALLGQEKPRKGEELEALPNGAGELSLTLSATADYLPLFNYLSDLESLRRPVKIDSLRFSSADTETGKVLILLVGGRTPYLKEASQKKLE